MTWALLVEFYGVWALGHWSRSEGLRSGPALGAELGHEAEVADYQSTALRFRPSPSWKVVMSAKKITADVLST
jgi:hypothetical protein